MLDGKVGTVNHHNTNENDSHYYGVQRGKFRPTNRKNPCPICDNVSGKCRTIDTGDMVLCGNENADTRGYKFLKPANNPLWNIFVIPTEQTHLTPEEWAGMQARREEDRARYEKLEADRIARLEQPELRDKRYRAVPATLSDDRRQSLLNRGLSDAEVDFALDNHWIWDTQGGFAIAALSICGSLIQGAQIARDDRDPKYIWDSKNQSAQLPDTGELPAFIWQHPDVNLSQPVRLIASEGALKPLVAAIKHWRSGDTQTVFIGAAGGNFGRKTLSSILEYFQPSEILLAVDAGWTDSATNVTTAVEQFLRQTEGKALWWGQIEKVDEDIDEGDIAPKLAGEQLSWEELAALHTRKDDLLGITAPQQIIEEFKGFCSKIREDKRKKYRERVPEIATVDRPRQRYVPTKLPNYKRGGIMPIFTLEKMSDRNLFVAEANQKGYKHVLDASGTGSGKSYTAAFLEPKQFSEEAKIWYFTGESRNPSTKEIQANFKELPVRNHGMERTDKRLPDGQLQKKPVYDQPGFGNCQNAHLFLLSGQKGFESEKEAENNPICKSCPFNRPKDGENGSQCANHEGQGFGFRYQRRVAMAYDRLRLNPMSAPAEIPSNLIAIWEEISSQLKVATRKTTLQEFSSEWWVVESAAPAIYDQIKVIRKLLSDEMLNPSEHYGTTVKHCSDKLNLQIPDEDRKLILQQLRPILCPPLSEVMQVQQIDNSKIKKERDDARRLGDSLAKKIAKAKSKLAAMKDQIPEDPLQADDPLFNGYPQATQKKVLKYWEWLTSVQSLTSQLNEAMDQERDASALYESVKSNARGLRSELQSEALKKVETSPTQTLWHILNILFFPHQGSGSFRISKETITVTLPDDRIKQITKSCELNLYLDATINEQVLKNFLGIESLLICELEQEQVNNVEHYQVIGFGRCGRNRAQSTNDRLKQLHEGIKKRESTDLIEIVDYKSVAEFGSKIRHLSNSRGSNEIEGSPVMVNHGLPKPNQGAIEDEYSCLNQPDFTFAQYYQYRIDAEVRQLLGRLRNTRYPDRKFAVYWVTDDPLPFEASQVKAIDISYQSAPKSQRMERSIFDAICEASRINTKLTQKLISQLAEVTQGFVSQWFAERGGWKYWKNLLDGKTISEIETYKSQLAPEEETMLEILPSMISESEDDADQILATTDAVFAAFGEPGFERVWYSLSGENRSRIKGALIDRGFPPDTFKELAIAA